MGRELSGPVHEFSGLSTRLWIDAHSELTINQAGNQEIDNPPSFM
jgi:hypothetical protein